MPLFRAYGSYGYRLATAGTDAALAIEVTQPVVQRPLFVSATAMIPAGVPTVEELGGFARVLVYAGAIKRDLTQSFFIQTTTTDIQDVLGVNRILLNQFIPMGAPCSLALPSMQGDFFSARESEALGAAILLASDQNGASMTSIVHLTFYGVSDREDAPRYKVI